MIYHNSQEEYYRSPLGALETGSDITLRIKVPDKINNVYVYYWTESTGNVKVQMSLFEKLDGYGVYSAKINVGMKPQLLWYNFSFEEEEFFYGNNEDGLGGEGKVYKEKPLSYQVTIYKKFSVPTWYKESVVYQIFPDRFNKSKNQDPFKAGKKNALIHLDWNDDPHYIRNEKGEVIYWDFFGGDLEGVMEKIDYLQELGINCIYFNPVFEARSNHRYDTGDYHRIDPMLGTNEYFEKMTKELAKKGIKVILDGVFSHTGADSIYFNKFSNYDSDGAYNSQNSKYFNWYIFGKYPEKYESWWGITDLPNVDEMEPGYQDFIYNNPDGVIRYWLEKGASGWRLDVVDELPEQFIKEIRKAAKATKEEAVIIGEVWEDASNKVSYGRSREYLLGDELDGATNYPLREMLISYINGEITAEKFHRKIMNIYENYPKESFYSTFNILGSHDVERIGSLISKEKLKACVYFQMAFPGVPVIYYGDESGLKGHKDPDNRKTYPWGNQDKDLLETYKEAIKMRKEHKVFVEGSFTSGFCNDNVYYFKRENEEELAIIVLNNASEESEYKIDSYQGKIMAGEVTVLYKKKVLKS
ncbi:MAG: glycoside hydrolase family 13 protein [Clostridia bacterium]|nr:glycoside hydrolase family 13 protein [Clostridia bacterium]